MYGGLTTLNETYIFAGIGISLPKHGIYRAKISDKETSIIDAPERCGQLVYPNPAFSFITLIEDATQHYERYEIYDVTSRKLQSEMLSGYRMDISFLEQGTYYLGLYNSSGMFATTGFLKIGD